MAMSEIQSSPLSSSIKALVSHSMSELSTIPDKVELIITTLDGYLLSSNTIVFNQVSSLTSLRINNGLIYIISGSCVIGCTAENGSYQTINKFNRNLLSTSTVGSRLMTVDRHNKLRYYNDRRVLASNVSRVFPSLSNVYAYQSKGNIFLSETDGVNVTNGINYIYRQQVKNVLVIRDGAATYLGDYTNVDIVLIVNIAGELVRVVAGETFSLPESIGSGIISYPHRMKLGSKPIETIAVAHQEGYHSLLATLDERGEVDIYKRVLEYNPYYNKNVDRYHPIAYSSLRSIVSITSGKHILAKDECGNLFCYICDYGEGVWRCVGRRCVGQGVYLDNDTIVMLTTNI